MNKSFSPLPRYFNAGNTDARIKRALPRAPSTKALGTLPTFLIMKELAGLEKAQTMLTNARL